MSLKKKKRTSDKPDFVEWVYPKGDDSLEAVLTTQLKDLPPLRQELDLRLWPAFLVDRFLKGVRGWRV